MAERAFTSESIAQRVTFGSGTRHSLGSELRRVGIKNVLILSGAHQESVARELADLSVDFHPTTFAGARMHTPVETTESALEIVTSLRIDGLALYGAWLCGIVLRSTAMALHHKLCHVLGGAFGLPHAETHSVILPHAVAFNQNAAGEAMHDMRTALGSKNAAHAVFDLARRIGAPASLREIGMAKVGIDRAVELALANPYWNPRPLEREGIRSLLDDAWHGRRPSE